jgi:hypothetical protein
MTDIHAAKNRRFLDTASVEAVCALPNELVIHVFDMHNLHWVDETARTHALPVDQPLLRQRVEHLD